MSEPMEQLLVPNKETNDVGHQVISWLSHNMSVTMYKYRGKTTISISEYYKEDGKQLPDSTKGVDMSNEDWSTFKSNITAIDEAILCMKGKTRSKHDTGVYPMVTTRFDGRNYNVWAREMKAWLQHLKIDYVIFGRSESSSGYSVQSEAVFDDHLCRCSILNYVSDKLFTEYSKKKVNAHELWKELRSLYFSEKYGDMISRVKNYINFKIVENKSILDQLTEFNDIVEAIEFGGESIDEKFHVHAILAKLPQTVQIDFGDEHVTLTKLMNILKDQEKLHTQETSHL